MRVRSITAEGAIDTFRLRQTIETVYRDMPEANSTLVLLTAARRDPPAVLTTSRAASGQPITTLIVDSGLWTRAGEARLAAETGEYPTGWALTAYREIGDMSLVAPLTAQAVIDAGEPAGTEELNGGVATCVTATTDVMLRLLTVDYQHSDRAKHDPAPPDSYINRYDARFWIDPATGFILREQTVVEYSEERLHGQVVGVGPATFRTTREFYDFNAALDIPEPGP
jgi:hypothetical protein